MSSCGGNKCSQGGSYYSMSFGAKPKKKPMYKNHVVYSDSKGRYIKVKTKKGLTKRYLPKGAKTTSSKKRRSPVRRSPVRRSPVRRSPVRRSPYKPVKNKRGKNIGSRLSARAVYDEYGNAALNKKFNILQKDGSSKLKVLKLRKNGSPFFSNSFGKVQPTHVNSPLNYNWLRGPKMSEMTGNKLSWPATHIDKYGVNFKAPKYGLLPPAGVEQPLQTNLLPRYITSFGTNMNKPHMHFGKMCFGA